MNSYRCQDEEYITSNLDACGKVPQREHACSLEGAKTVGLVLAETDEALSESVDLQEDVFDVFLREQFYLFNKGLIEADLPILLVEKRDSQEDLFLILDIFHGLLVLDRLDKKVSLQSIKVVSFLKVLGVLK